MGLWFGTSVLGWGLVEGTVSELACLPASRFGVLNPTFSVDSVLTRMCIAYPWDFPICWIFFDGISMVHRLISAVCGWSFRAAPLGRSMLIFKSSL